MAGVDALAVGIEKNSAATVAMLAKWADLIWLAEDQYAEAIPEAELGKVISDLPTGPDVFGFAENATLSELAITIAGTIRERAHLD